jgi:hypothetical protein
MRDIGGIEKRLENLEYYTSLSLLEQDAVNKQDLTILDSTNYQDLKMVLLLMLSKATLSLMLPLLNI